MQDTHFHGCYPATSMRQCKASTSLICIPIAVHLGLGKWELIHCPFSVVAPTSRTNEPRCREFGLCTGPVERPYNLVTVWDQLCPIAVRSGSPFLCSRISSFASTF